MDCKCVKLKQYMQFIISNEASSSIEFRKNSLYGYKNNIFTEVENQNIDNYNVIFRFLYQEEFGNVFRVLKIDENDIVDFKEEIRMITPRIPTHYY